jgi:hypothetical protein
MAPRLFGQRVFPLPGSGFSVAGVSVFALVFPVVRRTVGAAGLDESSQPVMANKTMTSETSENRRITAEVSKLHTSSLDKWVDDAATVCVLLHGAGAFIET